MSYKIEILRPDRTPWLSNILDFPDHWPWITSQMEHHFGCDYADIDVLETETHGDILVVKDAIVGLLPVPVKWVAPQPKSAPGNFVTEGTTDKVGVTLAVEDDTEANPRIRVRWVRDLSVEWVRSEYLYPLLAE